MDTAIHEEDYATEDSDHDYGADLLTPNTPLSSASPKKQPKCRDKHLLCPYDGCGKLFNRPARLEEHKRSHTNERIFKCPDPNCTKDFLRKTHLQRHVEANHSTGQKSYVCKYEDCRQSFVTNQRLKRHHLVHEKRDKYRCTEPGCDATFRKHNTLSQHIRTAHQGQAAYPCDEVLEDGSICPKGFASTHYLRLHKGRDHGFRSYFCTVCPSSSENAFATFSDLQVHNKVVHPPTCDVCGYTAKTSKELGAHIQRKHSSDSLTSRQTFICPFPECQGKGFVEKKNLNLHIRNIHEDQKPYQCGDTSLTLNHVEGWDLQTACGRAFSHKATLENHIRTMHMGLESMQTIREKRKRENDPQSAPRPKKRSKPSKLDHLTGQSMINSQRTIACPCQGCNFMFVREWDKVVHLKSHHGIYDDDDWLVTSGMNDEENDDNEDGDEFGIATRLMGTRRVDEIPAYYITTEERLEALANEGGQFWIGGVDDGEDVQFDPYYDDALDVNEENGDHYFLEEE